MSMLFVFNKAEVYARPIDDMVGIFSQNLPNEGYDVRTCILLPCSEVERLARALESGEHYRFGDLQYTPGPIGGLGCIKKRNCSIGLNQ